MVELGEVRAGQVVIVGAPVDEGTSFRPGARFGPRAIREADDGFGPPDGRYHLDRRIRPFAALDVVDMGDLPVAPGHPEHNLSLIERAVAEIVRRDATPVVLGGDHSIARATVAGAVSAGGPVHLVQLDTHTDTARPGGLRPPGAHGSPMRRLVDEGIVDGGAFQQLGLRGWWPGEEELAWARERGMRWWTMRECRRQGLEHVVEALLGGIGAEELLWLSVDIDVVDPAFAPGTGTPEPGGMTSWELLGVVGRLARARRLRGFELVEVSPPYDVAGITAMLAHRTVLELLSAVAARAADAPEPAAAAPSSGPG